MARNRLYVNEEGYSDSTAGRAIQNENREKRKKVRMDDMAKKRNCRRTTDENILHEKAVKMWKMTDEQLVHYVEDRVEKARSEGFNQGKQHTPPAPKIDIPSILEGIAGIRGIGVAKLTEIKAVLESRLEASDG